MLHVSLSSLFHFIFSPIFPASILIMINLVSSKRKALSFNSAFNFSNVVPTLTTSSAQSKYRSMRHNLCPGSVITFHRFPKLFENFKNVGWDCLISFNDKSIFPCLVAEFYSHMEFLHDSSGLLKTITTCIQGQPYVIDELFLVNALQLHPSTLELTRINSYLHPFGISVEECMLFNFNLSVVTDQTVPVLLFDFPCKVGLEFLTAECQFLGKILRKNFMPARDDRKLLPFDLELIKGLLNECLPYNLAYFLLSSFEYCFHNDCFGFSLLLTRIFHHLNLPLSTLHSQSVPTSNIVAHLNLPPQPLSIFKPFDHETFEENIIFTTKINSLNSMNQLLLHNQSLMLAKQEDVQLSLYAIQSMVFLLLELNNMFMDPFNVSIAPDFTIPPLADPVPVPSSAESAGNIHDLLHFSPLNLEEI